jgi:hypothetical protein
LDDRFDFGGYDILMSLGLLNELTGLVGDPTNIGAVDFDSDIQAQVIAACVAERTKFGKRKSELNIDELPVSVAQVEALLDWVKAHVMDYFVRRLTANAALVNRHQKSLKGLEHFLTGSTNEPSVISSAGPSA